MATYIGIKGVEIQTIAGDPANPLVGQVWYNTTTNTLKGYGAQGTAAWASGGSLNQFKALMMGAGTQTAFIMAGGGEMPPPGTWNTPVATTETYDGSTWTEVNDMNTARRGAAPSTSGTQTAMLVAGGTDATSPGIVGTAETYDGSTWTEITALDTARTYFGGAGTSTAALAYGGGVTTGTALTESWNGTSWTEENALQTARYAGGFGGGTQTAAMCIGGEPAVALVETFDGTSWTEVGDLNTGRPQAAAAVSSPAAALYMGGSGAGEAVTGIVESYDGSTWTEIADLSTARQAPGGGGTSINALVAGGMTSRSGAGSGTNVCEEFSTPDATKTFTSS